MNKGAEQMHTYTVHVQLGDLFEDVYVEARSPAEAEHKAAKACSFRTHPSFRWARFTV